MADDAAIAQVRMNFYQAEQVRILNALATRDRATLLRMTLASAMRSGELRSMLDTLGYDSDKFLEGTSVPERGFLQPVAPIHTSTAPAASTAPPVSKPVESTEPAPAATSATPMTSATPIEVSSTSAAPVARSAGSSAEPELKQKVPPSLKLTGFFGEKPRVTRNNQ